MCTSGEAEDLATTDRIATEIVAGLRDSSPEKSKQQYEDNYLWITQAADHKLVRTLQHLPEGFSWRLTRSRVRW